MAPVDFPPCTQLIERYHTGTVCLQIDVNAGFGYWLDVAAVVVYVLSGCDGSPTHRFLHRYLYPLDEPPPNRCV